MRRRQRFAPYNDERYGRSQRGLFLRDYMSRPRRERLGDPFRLSDVGNFGGSGDVDENRQQHIDTQHYISDQRGTESRERIGMGEQQTAYEFPTRIG